MKKESGYRAFPLTSVQLAYLMGRNENYELGGVSTHIYYEMETQLEIKKIEIGLNEVMKVQPMLRAVIDESGIQKVYDEVPYYPIERIDLKSFSAEEQQSVILEERNKMSHKLFPLGVWPMFEFKSYLLSEKVSCLVFSFDMLIADGSSIAIFFDEVLNYCEHGEEIIPIENTFEKFIYTTLEEKKSKRYQNAKKYWVERVKEFPLAPEIPIKSGKEIRRPIFKRLEFKLEQEKWNRLKELANEKNLSPTIVMATVYSKVLNYWSNQERFALNFTLSDRRKMKGDINRVIGDFTASIPIEIQSIQMEHSDFWEAARKFKNSFIESYKRSIFEGIEVINLLAKENNLKNSAVLPIVFTSMLLKENPFDVITRIGKINYSISQTPQVYLDCQVMEVSGTLNVSWDYVEDLFDEDVIFEMFQQFSNIVRALSFGDVEVNNKLQPSSKDKLVYQKYNDTCNKLEDITLSRLITPSFVKYKDKIAVKDKQKSLTYEKLDQLSNLVAEKLISSNIKPGEFVGIEATRTVETIVNIIGVVKSGAAYVPINPEHPLERRNYMLEHSGCKLYLTSNIDSLEFVDSYKQMEWLTLARPKDPAYVIYTSGSTGKPKGVVISNTAVCNTIIDINHKFEINQEDKVIGISSFCFDLSVFDIFGSLAAGATLVIVQEPRNLSELRITVQKEKITVWNTVPAIMELFVEDQMNMEKKNAIRYWQSDSVQTVDLDYDGLRVVMLSGDWIPLPLPKKIKSIFQEAKIYSLGGATEASIWSVYYPIEEVSDQWNSIPYGYPLTNQQLYILDKKKRICPTEVLGEIYIAGKGVATGYLNDEIKTQESFLEDGYYGRMYKTGDYGKMKKEGYIEFKGRMDSQIKIRGHRIELEEIEHVLEEHHNVEHAVVVTQKNMKNVDIICAYIISDHMPEETQLMEWCNKKLPDYMIPKRYVNIKELPLTFNGKINKKRLPNIVELEEEKTVIKPMGKTEEVLYKIWSNLLKVNHLSVEDNFFEVGGDSIVMLQIVAEIERQLQVKVKLQEFLNHGTIRELATLLNQLSQKKEGKPYESVKANWDDLYKEFPLTDVQMAYFVGRNKNFEMGAVNAHAFYELDTQLELSRLEEALNMVIRQQPMLRAVITKNGKQKILRQELYYKIPIVDLAEVPVVEQTKYLQEERQRMSHSIKDPYTWPLFEFKYIKLGQNKQRLMIGFELLIADGTSMRIIVKEIMDVYSGRIQKLKSLDFTFRDYLIAKKSMERGSSYRHAKEYWKEKIIELQPAPKVYHEKRVEEVRGKFHRLNFQMPQKKWEMIKKEIKKKGVSSSAYLCTMFSKVLAYWSNQPHHTINITIFNRYPVHKDVVNIIGDFTSIMLLDVNLEEKKSLWKQIEKVQHSLIEGIENSCYEGMNVIREYSQRNGLGTYAAMPVVFTSMLFNDEKFDSIGEFGEVVYSLSQTPQVFLDCQVMEIKDKLNITWDYVEDLFDNKMIQEMFEHYKQMIEWAIIGEEATNLITLNSKTQKIWDTYNETAKHMSESTLIDMIKPSFTKYKNKIAVKDNKNYLTYGELDRLSDEIAVRLQERGVRAGDFVGIYCTRTIETIVNIIGVIKSGAAYVPIDVEYPEERKNYIISHSGCRVILNSNELSKIDLDHCRVYEGKKKGKASDTAYVIYTSGSTGNPKGVVISNRAVCNTVTDINRRFAITQEDNFIGISSFCFDLSVYDVFGSISAGGKLVLASDARNIEEIVRLVKKEKITVWNTVPAIMELFIEERKRETGQINSQYWKESLVYTVDFEEESLRVVMLSGDWIPLKLPEKINEIYDGAKVYSLGGATEAAIWSIFYPIDCVQNEWESIPYGYPLSNQQVYVLNYEGNPCPLGVIGEIYIGGMGVAQEYQKEKEKTEQAFILSKKYGRLFKTGDFGVMQKEGYIVFKGRRDQQVKIRGHRIELGEIESVLTEVNGVDNAFVVIKKNRNKVEYLCAYITTSRKIEEKELKERCKQKLPEYMIPIKYCSISEVPLTANGKIDKSELAKMNIEESIEYNKPFTKIEKYLEELWCSVLKVKQIGVNENFFEIGGDSVKAIQIYMELHNSYNISVRELFEHQTIKELAEILKESEDGFYSKIQGMKQKNNLQSNTLELKNNKKKQYFNRINSELNELKDSKKNKLTNILLTGVTGYLGIYLLKELLESTRAEVFVIIRGRDNDDSIRRLKHKIEFYHEVDLYSRYEDRIHVYCGDITQDKFGMKEDDYIRLGECECIVNAAGKVSHFGRYEEIYAANVESVKQVIAFAKFGKKKTIYHISSSMVASGGKTENDQIVFTEYDTIVHPSFDDDYSKTKYLAEELLVSAREDGVDLSILRIGNIVFESKTGKFQENIEENAFYSLLRAMIELGAVPKVDEKIMEFSFVDYVSKAICTLVKWTGSKNQIFHITNQKKLNLIDFSKKFGVTGKRLDVIPYDEFLDRLYEFCEKNKEKQYIQNIMVDINFLIWSSKSEVEFVSDKTDYILKKLNFNWSKVSEDMLEKMYHYAKNLNFFN